LRNCGKGYWDSVTEMVDGLIVFDDEYFMRKALVQAQQAADQGEIPVGAIAVCNGKIVGRAYNQVELLQDATAHAEILVMTQVSTAQRDWRMEQVDIYVTKEPCAMCAGAMVNARVRRVIYGMADPRSGAAGSALDVTGFAGMLHQVEVVGGVLADDCKALMQDFFRKVRAEKSRKSCGPGCCDKTTGDGVE